MTLKDLAQMFNRALTYSFGIKKNFCLFVILILSGLVYLFFQALASYAVPWLQLPLKYIPLFLVIGFVMAAGIFLIRLYAKEREGGVPVISKIAWHSWDLILKASYLALPLLLIFLVFWVLLGIFILLKAIPYLGTLLGIILAFAPFLLNFGTLILFLAALLAFFFIAPSLAAKEQLDRAGVLQRLREDFFSNLLLLGVAYLPVWIVWKFAGNAATMTLQLYAIGDNPIEMVLRSVFIMLPFAAILAPAVTFFFNFAYESYHHLSLTKQVER